MTIRAATNHAYDRYLVDGLTLEIVWTVVPAIILIGIALPSMQLLYLMDETVDPSLTIKIIGHQWFWEYEYPDQEPPVIYESYMVPAGELEPGQLRLLEVDHRLIVPVDAHIRILVTSDDVLHSFAVPALGIKIDAVPGRLNQVGLLIKRPGVFYGQCSELCGANHSFMPIVIEAVSSNKFIDWILTKSEGENAIDIPLVPLSGTEDTSSLVLEPIIPTEPLFTTKELAPVLDTIHSDNSDNSVQSELSAPDIVSGAINLDRADASEKMPESEPLQNLVSNHNTPAELPAQGALDSAPPTDISISKLPITQIIIDSHMGSEPIQEDAQPTPYTLCKN